MRVRRDRRERRRAPRIDLHCHTDHSDGRFPPLEVVERAVANGLEVLALTDHDLPPPLPPGRVETASGALRVIAATEVSGTHEGREYHLLVYFPGEMPPAYAAWLRTRAASRAVRYDAALDALGAHDVPRAAAEARAGERALTRHHLARALVDAGRAKNFSAAMRVLVETPVVPPIDVGYLEAIRVAREAGGFPSWAHPPLAAATQHAGTFARAGLLALEGLGTRRDRSTRNGLHRLASKHGLLLTGGTDWHGWMDGPLGLYGLPDEHAFAFLRKLDGPGAAEGGAISPPGPGAPA